MLIETLVKVIVCGGRDFTDYDLFCARLDYHLQNCPLVEIVSGGARGADSLAIDYAVMSDHRCTTFPADWERFGKSAGYRRNEQMAKYATHCLAFWDGKSRGTGHMIDLARKHGLGLKIVRY